MEYLKKAKVRPAEEIDERRKSVAAIISNVRENGDRALQEYSRKFDGNTRTSFRVTPEEIRAAYAELKPEEIADLKQAAGNIRALQKRSGDA